MNAFAPLDSHMLATALALFGESATLHPMMQGPAGPNAASVADPDRAALAGVRAIRSEWSERVGFGGQGMPMPAGAKKLASSGVRHIATVAPASLGWTPRKGDEIAFADRPGERYRIVEPMPDGLAGLHLGLQKV